MVEVNVFRYYERVEQGLEGRSRLARDESAAEQVLDHRRVLHLGPCAQGQDLVQEQRSEATLGDRGEVGARSLDPEHTLLATRVIDEDALGRGVSPASI